MRTARLGSGARKPRAAKGLHTNDRADDITIYIDVAGIYVPTEKFDGRFDAAVNTECQTVTAAIDLFVQRFQLIRSIANKVNDWAEDFLLCQPRRVIDVVE